MMKKILFKVQLQDDEENTKAKNFNNQCRQIGDRRRWDDTGAMMMKGLRCYRRLKVEGGCDGSGRWKWVLRRWKVVLRIFLSL
ncbi:hypothetical protein A2U01_0021403 [Trifolium medium]|uniref:Uncharacterized protein n=1 Tax=Trifolium medium TaxID=97028 RepID=A0A392NPF7_9FABA|nr:hypothetical protein [Trifolium medium]